MVTVVLAAQASAARFNMVRFALLAGGLLCLFAVAIGAFGAHALSDVLIINQRVEVFELANRYQFYHGLALLLMGLVGKQFGLRQRVELVLMFVGTLIFSGSLYLLALSNISWLGAITPIGGTCLLAAWVLFLVNVVRNIR